MVDIREDIIHRGLSKNNSSDGGHLSFLNDTEKNILLKRPSNDLSYTFWAPSVDRFLKGLMLNYVSFQMGYWLQSKKKFKTFSHRVLC